ncbi:MAG: tyrosine-type recombinase/integrase [Acetatifactor sp.]
MWGNYHSSHKVRYLGITKLYEAGVDEAIIQKTAGHSTIEMTRHYNKDRRACSVDCETWNDLFGRQKKA